MSCDVSGRTWSVLKFASATKGAEPTCVANATGASSTARCTRSAHCGWLLSRAITTVVP